MQENQFSKKGLYSLINRLINNDCGYLIPYSLLNFAPLLTPLSPFHSFIHKIRLYLLVRIVPALGEDGDLGFGVAIDADVEDLAVPGEPGIGPAPVVADAYGSNAVDNAWT